MDCCCDHATIACAALVIASLGVFLFGLGRLIDCVCGRQVHLKTTRETVSRIDVCHRGERKADPEG